MKKVAYSAVRVGRQFSNKMSGVGYIVDEDLVVACISKEGKAYIRVFEEVTKYCHPVMNRSDEFKGYIYEITNMELTDDQGRKSVREVTTDYAIWFKYIED